MKRTARSQHGFTLIELMVAMVIGMVIVIALITLLVNVNRSNTELAKSNRLIENGRLALQLLASDVAHGGFLGGFVPNFDDLTNTTAPTLANVGGQVPTAVADPCTAFDPATWTSEYKANLVGTAVAAWPIPTGTSPAAPVCGGIVTHPKGGTDMLVVRHAEPCVATVAGSGDCNDDSASAANPHVYFQPSRCSTDSTTYGTGTFVLSTGSLLLRKRLGTGCDVEGSAPKYRWASTLYYIRTYANTVGDGIPTLMRSTFGPSGSSAPAHLSAQPLIEGVEAMVVEFGLDNQSDSGAAANLLAAVSWADTATYSSPTNRGDGNPDTYVRCTSASSNPCDTGIDPPEIVHAVAVKVWLLVRGESITLGQNDTKTYNLGSCGSSCTFGPFNDKYKRHVFAQTIRLTNVSGRRETP